MNTAELERERAAVEAATGLTFSRDASSIARRPLPDGRRPLFIAPIEAEDDDSPPRDRRNEATAQAAVAESVERLGEAANNPARVKDIFELGIAMTLELSFDDRDFTYELVRKLKAEHAAKAAELQLENAQLKAVLAEIRAKVNEIAFVQERLQLDRCGPPGAAGPRGADGPRGEVGLRGERGEPGRAAPTIVAWTTDDANFVAWPVFSNGVKATAGLHLHGMFEEFSEQIDASDADEAHDADRAQRGIIEREAANVRAGLPAR